MGGGAELASELCLPCSPGLEEMLLVVQANPREEADCFPWWAAGLE